MAVLALVVAHDFDQTVARNSVLSSSPTTPPCFSIPRLGLHDKVVQFRPAPDRWIIVRQVRVKPDLTKYVLVGSNCVRKVDHVDMPEDFEAGTCPVAPPVMFSCHRSRTREADAPGR